MARVLKLLLALNLSIVLLYYNATTSAEEALLNLEKQDQQLLEQVTSLVQKNYIEEVSESVIIEGAIKGIVSNLDPHSNYLTPKEYKEINNITSGQFSGIGVELVPVGDNGIFKVISPYENGPAFKAGIKAGDLIIAVNGVETLEMGKNKVIASLRGDAGTKVEVKIQRANGQQYDIRITREHIKIIPVKAKMIANNIAYINISGFNNITETELKKEYKKLLKNSQSKIRGLILDLRWNPGGLLDQAVAVSKMFLNDCEIVSVRSRIGELNETYRSEKDGDITEGLPIVAIINAGSASAAEVVAGALQDNKRALLVGTKSFGKASVQNVIPLQNGGALKLTTALYYTPSGKSIQADGIEPDIYAQEGVVVQATKTKKIGEIHLKGHITSPKTAKTSDTANDRDTAQNNSNLEYNHNKATQKESNHQPTSSSTIEDDQEVETDNLNLLREKIGDEKTDFQLLRAIDTIQSMVMYHELNNKEIEHSAK